MSDLVPPGMTRRELRRRAEMLRAARPESGEVPFPEQEREPVRILMVCTGNVCRSPLAEVTLRARMEGAPVRVHSAGTRALIDKSMTADAQDVAIGRGAAPRDAAMHRARWLIEPIAEDADLVLAMSREHRTSVVELAPRLLRQTFTIREFARLAGTLADEEIESAADSAGTSPRARLAAVTGLVVQQRGATASAPGEDDDVIDPYRRSRATYEISAEQLIPAVDEVARVLRAAL